MRTVFVQRKDDDWLSPNQANAASGFRNLGYDVQGVTYEDMLAGKVPVTEHTIVHGGIGFVVHALSMLGLDRPRNFDMPSSLRSFVKRKIWNSVLGEIRHRISMPETYEITFIKPLEGHKAFTGHVVRAFRDLLITVKFPDDFPIMCSEVVHFASEYRFFVLNQEVRRVLGVGHYAGDPLIFPDPQVVRAALHAFTDAPVAYSLDMGVVEYDDKPSETMLIETNDAFSLGCYGLNGLYYARMIEARWDEMVQDGKQEKAMQGLVEITEEMGLYEDEFKNDKPL